MAHWLLQVFLWYGVVAQFQQICCFGDTRPGAPSSEKTFEFRARHSTSRDLQRKKGFVGVAHLKGAVRRFNDMTDSLRLPAINVTSPTEGAQTLQNKSGMATKKTKCYIRINEIEIHTRKCGALFGKQRHRLRYSRNLKSNFEYKDQVPDYDFEDKSEEIPSVETDDITFEKTSPSPRYFYHNGAKKLVNEAQQESEKYYNEKLKKRAGRGMILNPRQREAERERVRQYNETVLQATDNLEALEAGGPSFKGTMIWVNMMRSNRGWYPKGTSP